MQFAHSGSETENQPQPHPVPSHTASPRHPTEPHPRRSTVPNTSRPTAPRPRLYTTLRPCHSMVPSTYQPTAPYPCRFIATNPHHPTTPQRAYPVPVLLQSCWKPENKKLACTTTRSKEVDSSDRAALWISKRVFCGIQIRRNRLREARARRPAPQKKGSLESDPFFVSRLNRTY